MDGGKSMSMADKADEVNRCGMDGMGRCTWWEDRID